MKRPKRSRLLMVISLSSALGMLLHSMLTLADQHLRERYRLRQQDFELALRIISEPTKFDDPARAWASGVVEEYTRTNPEGEHSTNPFPEADCRGSGQQMDKMKAEYDQQQL